MEHRPRPAAHAFTLALALLDLAGDPELRQRLAAAGRRRVCERFGIDRQVEAFDQLYREILELPRRARS